MTVLNSSRPEAEIEELLDSLRPRMRGVLAGFRIPPEDAEDLLQQTVLTFLVKRETIHDPERWLIATLKNRCVMHWRSYRKRIYESVDSAILDHLAQPAPPDQERSELASDLNRIVRQLSPQCRSVLKLRYGLGFDPAETAARTGYKSSGIYKIVERCLGKLLRKLVDSGVSPPRSAVPLSLTPSHRDD